MKRFICQVVGGLTLITLLSACSMDDPISSSTVDVKPDTSDQSTVTDSADQSMSANSESDSAKEESGMDNSDASASDMNDDAAENLDSYTVELENRTGSDIYGLQYALTGSDGWGEEYASDWIEDGQSTTLDIPRGEDGERFDIRGYDNEEMTGDGWIFPDIDFTQDGRIILRYKDDAPDYEYE